AEVARDDLLRADGVYRWFRARAEGESVRLWAPDGAEAARFTFPRQRDGERLCLADYVREDVDDAVALFVVTCGGGVREQAQAWKEQGAYLKSHALQVLAIESAEAFAEMLHARLRTLWGFPDPPLAHARARGGGDRRGGRPLLGRAAVSPRPRAEALRPALPTARRAAGARPGRDRGHRRGEPQGARPLALVAHGDGRPGPTA